MGILVIDLRKTIRIMILLIMAAFVLSVVPATTLAAEVPGVPIEFSVASGDGYAELAWSEPTDDGGSAITGYRIYYGMMVDGLSIVEDVTDLHYTFTGLANDQTYYFAVSALNAEGEGEKSNIIPLTPGGGAPLMTEITVKDYETFVIIYVGEGIYFDVADDTETLIVDSVTSTSASMTISWGTQSLTMSEGDTKNVDVDGDGTDDFKITCKTITSEPAEGFPQTVEFSLTTNIGGSGGGTGGTPGFELILVLVAVALVLFWQRKRI
jgi:hypothetical protein